MKIVLATPLYPPDSGGPATYAKLVCEHLPDEVVLVKFSDVRHLPKGIRHIAYFWRVLRAGKQADVIFALDPVSTGLPALWAARILRKPFVVKIVGDFAWEQGSQRFGVIAPLDEFVQQKKVPFVVACLRGVQTRVARSATRVIVPSHYLQGIVLSWSRKLSAEKISVIYNSIQLPELSKVEDHGEKGGGSAGMRIVSAGRLVPWKGMSGLIDVVAQLQKTDAAFTTVSLTIVGDGPDRAKLMEKAAKELGAAVTFTGALPHAEALKVVASADVYVQNSSYEGLSHQLIEALMLGRVIVATSAGGNPELIQDGENGLLVPFGDKGALVKALHTLLSDAELRARFAAHAIESTTRFQVPTMIAHTHELLASLYTA